MRRRREEDEVTAHLAAREPRGPARERDGERSARRVIRPALEVERARHVLRGTERVRNAVDPQIGWTLADPDQTARVEPGARRHGPAVRRVAHGTGIRPQPRRRWQPLAGGGQEIGQAVGVGAERGARAEIGERAVARRAMIQGERVQQLEPMTRVGQAAVVLGDALISRGEQVRVARGPEALEKDAALARPGAVVTRRLRGRRNHPDLPPDRVGGVVVGINQR